MLNATPVLLLFTVLGYANTSQAANYTWVGGAKGTWHNAANWNPNRSTPTGGDAAVLTSANGTTTIMLAQATTLQALTFNHGALNACTLTGKPLSFANGAAIRFSKLPGDVGMGKSASATINCNLHLSGDVKFDNMNRHYLGGEKLAIRGKITGDGTIFVGGVKDGIVQLFGDNTNYKGAFVIQTGNLMLSHAAALGSGKEPVRMNGGAIVMGARVSTDRDFAIAADATWDAHGPNGNHDGTFTVERDATLTIKNGGGNTMTVRGIIAGDGHINIVAHGTTFAGNKANALKGSFHVGGSRGATTLARDKGANVITSSLVMKSNGVLRWQQDDQVADTASVTFAGEMPTLDFNGHHEQLGTLNLQSDGRIDVGQSDNRAGKRAGNVSFADSSRVNWSPDKVLLIRNGSKDRSRIRFGTNSRGLTAAQLNRIGFVDPAGFTPGTYTAKLTDDGMLQPTGSLVTPVDLPVDLSDAARAKRTALYDVPGLRNLSGKQTPLSKGTVIAVFGDSITWGGGYLKVITDSLRQGAGTASLGVKVINHGVNGGGVLTIRDGDNSKAHAGNTKPEPFAKVIADDKADVAVIFIGVNDVWWRKTSPEDFEKALRDIVAQARANKTSQTIPVLATLAILKETVGQTDPKCDAFAAVTRKVARETKTTLVDLRAGFMACMANESITIRPGGSWTSNGKLLAHDGVHTNARGNAILANLIAHGVYEALSR